MIQAHGYAETRPGRARGGIAAEGAPRDRAGRKHQGDIDARANLCVALREDRNWVSNGEM